MPATYSMEFRRAVAKAYDDCGSSIEVAEQIECSESWVRRVMQAKPLKLPDNHKLDADDLEQLTELIRKTPDMTLGELAAALQKKVSVSAVSA